MAQSTVESKNKKDFNNGKIPAKETILSPRFYTTDFEAMENMDLSINEEELEAICEAVSYTHLTLPTTVIV